MGLYKVKNLYINGCSFTYGDSLPKEQTWPELLSKKLNLNLLNHSVNGNSMQSITFNSVNYLSKLSSEDTLVVIGLTWEPRYMVQIGQGVINLTPMTEGREEVTFVRMQSPITLDDDIEFKLLSSTKDGELPLKPLKDFTQYYNSLIEHDFNLEENQKLNLITNIVYLQSYLKQNNFDYRFINFDQIDFNLNFPILKQIDRSKIITFDSKPYKDDPTAHPNKEHCIEISERIYDSING
tara:strand:+ start:300 stop:1013 length:714 start_codon:yes stop_codon:yes gene_type:complete